ncbi:ATP-binding protein [Bradyrhizobium sp.]|uniref:AlbA family DNA-binding domain-containing protein n=1 Tax=Bradyrhizobium sp. TaxID=376 RepID=UPI00260E3507|nr:ATP-binding protein [Bradyrhizobium sp.]
MSLSSISFDNISEAHLSEQVSAGVPEGVLVDYKRDMYGRADADVKEFLKDVSSFANSSGGHLAIGIDEVGGVPSAISALSGDPDQDLQRLESLVRDGLEPRISGLRMKAISISGGGGYVLLLRIPKSWNPPHRVSARNTNRIYGRNSAGAYEFSVEELRVLFTSSATALDRVRLFRAQRLAKIDAGEAIAPLVKNNGRLVLHLLPASSFGIENNIDLAKANTLQELLKPMGTMGYSPRINFDGFSTLSHGANNKCVSYTQVFRTGAIEAVKVRVTGDPTDGAVWIPTLAFDRWIFQQLPNYFAALQQLEVPPPIVLMVTLQGVRGARLGVEPRPIDDPPQIDRDVLELPEAVIEQYGAEESYQRASRPVFDALWNTGGYSRSKHFDQTGKWTLSKY